LRSEGGKAVFDSGHPQVTMPSRLFALALLALLAGASGFSGSAEPVVRITKLQRGGLDPALLAKSHLPRPGQTLPAQILMVSYKVEGLELETIVAGEVEVDRATDDLGNDLKQGGMRLVSLLPGHSPFVVPGARVPPLSLQLPSANATSIPHLDGTVELVVPSRDPGSFLRVPLSGLSGKTHVDFPALDEIGLDVTMEFGRRESAGSKPDRPPPGELWVQASGNVDRFLDVTLETLSGVRVPFARMELGGNGTDAMRYSYTLDAARNDVVAVLHVATEASIVKVPFHFVDVRLPAPDNAFGQDPGASAPVARKALPETPRRPGLPPQVPADPSVAVVGLRRSGPRIYAYMGPPLPEDTVWIAYRIVGLGEEKVDALRVVVTTARDEAGRDLARWAMMRSGTSVSTMGPPPPHPDKGGIELDLPEASASRIAELSGRIELLVQGQTRSIPFHFTDLALPPKLPPLEAIPPLVPAPPPVPATGSRAGA
jgi:hypothetical protein